MYYWFLFFTCTYNRIWRRQITASVTNKFQNMRYYQSSLRKFLFSFQSQVTPFESGDSLSRAYVIMYLVFRTCYWRRIVITFARTLFYSIVTVPVFDQSLLHSMKKRVILVSWNLKPRYMPPESVSHAVSLRGIEKKKKKKSNVVWKEQAIIEWECYAHFWTFSDWSFSVAVRTKYILFVILYLVKQMHNVQIRW